MTSLKHIAKVVAHRMGISAIAYRLYGFFRDLRPAMISRNLRVRKAGAPDGFPIPPPHLLFLVSGGRDVDWFLSSGRAGWEALRETLHDQGYEIAQFNSVLDFGCGCGRVLRHWHGVLGPQVFGCDYNPKLTRWATSALPFTSVSTNSPEPPLQYADESFDLVYALSVFTHLTEPVQRSWMKELHRILAPGGLLYVTLHGSSYADSLTPEERERFTSGDLVVRDEDFAGTNICAAYHPRSYVETELGPEFQLLTFEPEGARGNPFQDAYLLRKPGHPRSDTSSRRLV